MRTVTFHSFKGGRGRTTALASLANLLARVGRTVVILDLDLGAPWVATKFESSRQIPEGHGVRELLHVLRSERRGLLPVSLSARDYYTDQIDCPAGAIYLMAPTQDYDDSYWAWVAAELPSLVNAYDRPEIAALWRDLRDVIASDGEVRPDFLLVDAPAGLHPASVVIGAGMADVALVFGGTDDVGHERSKHLADELRRVRAAIDQHAVQVGALQARYPTFLDTTPKFREQEEALRRAVSADWAVTLDSDPKTQRAGSTPIAPRGELAITPLVRSLFLLAEKVDPERADEYANLMAGSPRDSELRLFWLEREGLLINPEDDQPNVAFKAQTLCGVLDSVHADMLEPVPGEDLLRNGGFRSGARFGEALRRQIESESRQQEAPVLLARWAEFDSEVGFGRIELADGDFGVSGNDLDQISVELNENFLARGRAPDVPRLCRLFEGYLQGVVERLLEIEQVEVAHLDEKCMQITPERRSCVFVVSRKSQPSID